MLGRWRYKRRWLRPVTEEAAFPADRASVLVLAPVCAVIWFGIIAPCAGAQEMHDAPRLVLAHINVQQLVRNAVYNQLQQMRHPAYRYRYTHREITRSGSTTNVEIETPKGMVARLTQTDGKPPSEAACQKNRAQLERILSSPGFARQRLKNQQSDLRRREQLFEALPHAVIFSYAGFDKRNGTIKLTYRPNPSFHPHLHVGGVLQGLAGEMWVDRSDQEILKINGHLVRTVSFGWGVFAKLYPGGRFTMQNVRLPDGSWKLTRLHVSFQGVILIFKKLNVNMTEIYTSFERVPDDLTLAEAVDQLSRIPVACGKQ